MTARRFAHAVLILCCGGLLTAADGGGCGPFPEPICTLECEHGFKTDSLGRTYCECKASDACIMVYPAPVENPDTGECVQFPTVCDIPAGWGPCNSGCTDGGVSYAEGDSFAAADGCNTCTCMADGSVACTEMACVGVCIYNGVEYTEGQSFPDTDGCNTCYCGQNGSISCTDRACSGCLYNGVQYNPGDSFPAGDNCNDCMCDQNGNVACTLAWCGACYVDGEWHETGYTFPAPDGCNTCTCVVDGGIACTEIACITCDYNGVQYNVGDSFPAGDGCNGCGCQADGSIICTAAYCAPICDGLDETTCDGAAGCDWLAPGCGGVYPSVELGCYPSIECQSASDCGAGKVCAQLGVDPCYHLACAACGMVRGVCVPELDVCFGAWWDQFGNCRGPADGVLPLECCVSDEQTQCTSTGGIWEPWSCGHYSCGNAPLCDAIIPGCDCGADKNFVAGIGCGLDAACGGACVSDNDCPAGAACNGCPVDPSCPMCAVCGPPVCEPIVCDFDVDCPTGSACVGSSICPPDVVCFWAGEPGICEPATP